VKAFGWDDGLMVVAMVCELIWPCPWAVAALLNIWFKAITTMLVNALDSFGQANFPLNGEKGP
jgi:hypothetical protein